MSQLILRAQNLHKDFIKEKTRLSIVKGVSLDIHQGDCLATMGASGAGKSTFLHLLGTLDRPTQGEVLFFSNEKNAMPTNLWNQSDEELSHFRNKNLGFIFQFHYLLPEFSALENVMMPALIAGESRELAEKRAKELLEFVGLNPRVDHRPGEMSGGEQQRVAIARAIMLRPKLLLADELTEIS